MKKKHFVKKVRVETSKDGKPIPIYKINTIELNRKRPKIARVTMP